VSNYPYAAVRTVRKPYDKRVESLCRNVCPCVPF